MGLIFGGFTLMALVIRVVFRVLIFFIGYKIIKENGLPKWLILLCFFYIAGILFLFIISILNKQYNFFKNYENPNSSSNLNSSSNSSLNSNFNQKNDKKGFNDGGYSNQKGMDKKMDDRSENVYYFNGERVERSLKKCPFCGVKIDVKAKLCSFCGRDLKF